MGREPGEVGRAPDGIASPTSSEGWREGSRVASPQGSPQAIFGDRTLVSEEGVSLLCSVTPVSGLWKQTDFGAQQPLVSLIPHSGGLRDSSSEPPCDDPCGTGLVGTLVDSPFTLKKRVASMQ